VYLGLVVARGPGVVLLVRPGLVQGGGLLGGGCPGVVDLFACVVWRRPPVGPGRRVRGIEAHEVEEMLVDIR